MFYNAHLHNNRISSTIFKQQNQQNQTNQSGVCGGGMRNVNDALILLKPMSVSQDATHAFNDCFYVKFVFYELVQAVVVAAAVAITCIHLFSSLLAVQLYISCFVVQSLIYNHSKDTICHPISRRSRISDSVSVLQNNDHSQLALVPYDVRIFLCKAYDFFLL